MAETLPNGAVVPNADGGEAISVTGVAEMRTLGASVDSALANKASIAYTDAQMAAARFTKGNPGPFDFDTMKTPGTYSLGTGFPTGWTNVPEGITTASILNVYGSPIQSWCAQELIQYGANPIRLWRISRTTADWNPWIRIGGGSGGGAAGIASAMASNAAWITDFIQRTEPVYTGGKAAFSLRLDHGYTNYKSLLRAGLLSRGIRPGIATNSRNWDIEENSGATISEVNGWVAAGDITILNHSATHYGGMDVPGLIDEIVNGRLELEAQLPAAAPVWGFAPPGVTQGWDGFGGGNKAGWQSPAAAIVLANHAYSCGYVGGTRRLLDGNVNQALGHITLDEYSMTAARSQVDAAIAEGRGIQMMMHPRELDKAGKISTADFFSLMDYIVAKRDAGDIVFLTVDEMVRADATRDFAEPIELGTEHLDTIIVPGEYYQSSSSEASTSLGYPVSAAGSVTVRANASRTQVQQQYVRFSSGVAGSWLRKYAGGVWGAWFESIMGDDTRLLDADAALAAFEAGLLT